MGGIHDPFQQCRRGVEVLPAGRLLRGDDALQPGQEPPGRRRLTLPRRIERPRRFLQPALLDIHPRQIDIPVPVSLGLVPFGQLPEGCFCLAEVPPFGIQRHPFQQAANAVVVPALPGRLNGRFLGRHFLRHTRHRKHHAIGAQIDDRQLGNRPAQVLVDILHVLVVKFAVAQPDAQLHRRCHIRRHLEAVVDHLAGAGRNLLVIEWCEDVLRIAPVDAVPMAVEHVHVAVMGPRVHLSPLIRARQSTIAANDSTAAARLKIHPDFVGIRCPLREGMADIERADHHLDNVVLTRLQFRQSRADDC